MAITHRLWPGGDHLPGLPAIFLRNTRSKVSPPVLTDPLFLTTCIVAVVILGLAKGGFSGVGMLATPMLALIIPPLQAAAILLPILLLQDAISVWTYRGDWDRWNVKVMLPGAVIGVCIAWALAAHLSDAMVRLIVGLIGLVFVLNTWFGRPPAEDHQPKASHGTFWGAVTGFTSTMVQAGSPPFQFFTLPQRMPKLTFVGTNAIFFAAINLMKLVPYSALGQFSSETLKVSLWMLPLAAAANYLGIWLVRVTPTDVFYRLAYIMVFFISITLTYQAVRGLI
jgi:uncharacterized membrane protein YfcA